MSDRDIAELEDKIRYLTRELSTACCRIQILELRVKDIEGHMTEMSGYAPIGDGSLHKGDPHG